MSHCWHNFHRVELFETQVPPVGLDVTKLSENELNRNPLLLGMKSNQKKKLPMRKLLIGQVNGTESSGAENIFLFFFHFHLDDYFN